MTRQPRQRYWVCYRQKAGKKCLQKNPRVKQKCVKCGGDRPAPRKPKHMVALEIPYEDYVAISGGVERCSICDRPRTEKDKRLQRDHDHRTGLPRGILCSNCNRFLHQSMTPTWLRAAADYLERTAA